MQNINIVIGSMNISLAIKIFIELLMKKLKMITINQLETNLVPTGKEIQILIQEKN
mgnify:CR=1 FL=1